MLENFNIKNSFEYHKLTEAEQQQRGILGRLIGPIADSINPTRNGRRYSGELWEKVFKNPIMQEKIENRVCFGELGHPTDRTETDMEKIAWCLAEVPKKGDDGQLYGVFDILSTPNGRILKSLCDYGCNIGASSRGSGDTFMDYDGQESVDPDSYDCECWDAVLIPAVKTARLKPVTESLDTSKTLHESLQELVNNASEEDKKVMEETIQNLNLDNSMEDEEIPEDEIIENVDNNKVNEGENLEADNDGAMIESLQVALKQKQDLEDKLLSLQEQLSVSYAKETSLEEQLAKYSKAIANLSNTSKKVNVLQKRIDSLTEQLKNEELNSNNLLAESSKLKNVISKEKGLKNSLKESMSNKDREITLLKEQIESLKHNKQTLMADNFKLMEQVNDLSKDIDLKKNEYSQKLENANKLVEKYKKISNKAVDKYIESQATRIGANANEIKNKLPESYTFSDIDLICEDMQNYKLTVSKLPFGSMKTLNENVKVNVKPSTNESILPKDEYYNADDEIDDMLKSFI